MSSEPRYTRSRDIYEAMNDFTRSAWAVAVYDQHGRQFSDVILKTISDVTDAIGRHGQVREGKAASHFFLMASQMARRSPQLLAAWVEVFRPGGNVPINLLLACVLDNVTLDEYMRHHISTGKVDPIKIAALRDAAERFIEAGKEVDRITSDIVGPTADQFIAEAEHSDWAKEFADRHRNES